MKWDDKLRVDLTVRYRVLVVPWVQIATSSVQLTGLHDVTVVWFTESHLQQGRRHAKWRKDKKGLSLFVKRTKEETCLWRIVHSNLMKEVSSSNVTERDNSPRQLNEENVNGDKRTGEQGSSLPVSVSRDLPELSQFTSHYKNWSNWTF